MKAKKLRYNIVGCYSDDTPMEELKEHIAECESIYLYETSEKLKKTWYIIVMVLEKISI